MKYKDLIDYEIKFLRMMKLIFEISCWKGMEENEENDFENNEPKNNQYWSNQ